MAFTNLRDMAMQMQRLMNQMDRRMSRGLMEPMEFMDTDMFDLNVPLPALTSGVPVGGMGMGAGAGATSGVGRGDEQRIISGEQQQVEPLQGTQQALIRPEWGLQGLQTLSARVNVEDLKDKYVVTAEMPGFDKQNIKINVSDDGLLNIKAEQTKEWHEQSKNKRYLRAERSFANVSRTLKIPKNCDAAKISASYDNGVLHVNLPKVETQQGQQSNIQIQ